MGKTTERKLLYDRRDVESGGSERVAAMALGGWARRGVGVLRDGPESSRPSWSFLTGTMTASPRAGRCLCCRPTTSRRKSRGARKIFLDLPDGTYGGTFKSIQVSDGVFRGVIDNGPPIQVPLGSIQAARVTEPNRPAEGLGYLLLGAVGVSSPSRGSSCMQRHIGIAAPTAARGGRFASLAEPWRRVQSTPMGGRPSFRWRRRHHQRQTFAARWRGCGRRPRAASTPPCPPSRAYRSRWWHSARRRVW